MSNAQVDRWRDARLLVAAFLEDDVTTAGELIKRRVDGQHRDEVKLFVAELARLAADLGQCWESRQRPELPVATLIKAQLLGPVVMSMVDRIVDVAAAAVGDDRQGST